MKSRASIQNDVTRIRDDIARVTTKNALVAILNRHDFNALPDRDKTDLREAVNARWKVVQ